MGEWRSKEELIEINNCGGLIPGEEEAVDFLGGRRVLKSVFSKDSLADWTFCGTIEPVGYTGSMEVMSWIAGQEDDSFIRLYLLHTNRTFQSAGCQTLRTRLTL